MNIQIAVNGVVDAPSYPLDTFYSLLLDLVKRVYDLSEQEISSSLKYPLTIKVRDTNLDGTDSNSFLECTITNG